MAVLFGDTTAIPPSDAEAGALLGLSTTLLSDAMNRAGAMQGAIRPIGPLSSFVASALTVSVMVGDNLALHHAAELIRPGHVVVVDGHGDLSTALWGEILHAMALPRGMRALVIDGCVRDSDALAQGPVPVWARGRVPTGPHKGWGGAINVPIQCGGVPVTPGDILVGDSDGIVVVPRKALHEVAGQAQKLRAREQEILRAIAGGATTVDILGLRTA
jgi:4-hydroxy-4-methyl-2-oxoglutarate aldolase